jgi:hypothetical protein
VYVCVYVCVCVCVCVCVVGESLVGESVHVSADRYAPECAPALLQELKSLFGPVESSCHTSSSSSDVNLRKGLRKGSNWSKST